MYLRIGYQQILSIYMLGRVVSGAAPLRLIDMGTESKGEGHTLYLGAEVAMHLPVLLL
jgi:hypothetical protein